MDVVSLNGRVWHIRDDNQNTRCGYEFPKGVEPIIRTDNPQNVKVCVNCAFDNRVKGKKNG